MKKRIYYFSGTGNSMRAAIRIAEKLGDAEIVSMREPPADCSAADCDVIGFVYPVYHWTMPEPAANFVRALEINPEAYIFAVAMPSFVLGFACEKLEGILNAKGASLSYGSMVRGVANYALVYPPMPSPKLVVPHTEQRLGTVADEISRRVKRAYPKAGLLPKMRYESVMPQYRSLQQYADACFTVSEDCISCGLCSRVCPCGNIRLTDAGPEFLRKCAQCMACVVYCPKRAIGFQLSDSDLKQLEESGLRVPVIKKMGLPPERKLYHNPYVSAADMSKGRIAFDETGRRVK